MKLVCILYATSVVSTSLVTIGALRPAWLFITIAVCALVAGMVRLAREAARGYES